MKWSKQFFCKALVYLLNYGKIAKQPPYHNTSTSLVISPPDALGSTARARQRCRDKPPSPSGRSGTGCKDCLCVSEEQTHKAVVKFLALAIIERELASRADQRVLRWLGHMERMDEYRMARKMLMADVGGGRVRWRPRLGRMDGVKVALGNRGMMVEAARQCAKDRKKSRDLGHI